MKAAFTALLLFPLSAAAQVPQLLNHQGRIAVGAANFDGAGQFKFALVNDTGTVTFWSNNGSSVAGSQPTGAVALTVSKGLYSVLLGDTSLTNMTAVPATVFNNADVRLRVWFNDGVNGFQQLTPDQRLAAAGFAMKAESANTATTAASATTATTAASATTATTAASAATLSGTLTAANVPADLITGAMIQNGQIGSADLAPGAVNSAALADNVDFGTADVNGQLDVFNDVSGSPSISLSGAGYQISTYGSDGLEQIRLWGPTWGEVLLRNSATTNDVAVKLSANGANGGLLDLSDGTGAVRAKLHGASTGGALTLFDDDGSVSTFLEGSSGGTLSLRTNTGITRSVLSGPNAELELKDPAGVTRVSLSNTALGIGTATPAAPLDVAMAGTTAGGVAGFPEVTARFLRTGGGHSAVSVDAPAGQDSLLYLSENGEAQWGLRQDSDDGHAFQLRYQAGGANSTILRVTPAGDARVTGSLTTGRFNVITSSALPVAAASTLTPLTGYMKLTVAGPGAITLNTTTAIADGTTNGQTLILQGTSDTLAISVPDNANTALPAARVLGLRDTLSLIWDGTAWVETAFSNN